MTQRLEEGKRGPGSWSRIWEGGWNVRRVQQVGCAFPAQGCFCTSMGLIPQRFQGALDNAQQ